MTFDNYVTWTTECRKVEGYRGPFHHADGSGDYMFTNKERQVIARWNHVTNTGTLDVEQT